MKEIILLNGGGMDSLVVLALLCKTAGPENVLSVHYDYGQRAIDRENTAVTKMSEEYGARFAGTEATPYLLGSTMTGGEPVNARSPHFVPQRNLVLLALAAAFAQARGSWNVAGGWQEGGTDCPDVQASWLVLAADVIRRDGFPSFELLMPLVHFTKESVIELGDELGVPWDLSWSCFEGGKAPCGRCQGCLRRQVSFERYQHRPDEGIRTRRLEGLLAAVEA